MIGKEWYLNVNKKPFGSGTNYLSKWGKILLFFPKIGSVKHKKALMICRLHLCDIDLFPRRWRVWKDNKKKKGRVLPHSTWQRFVAHLPFRSYRENTTLHHSPSPDSESSVGNGYRVNEEQIENRASTLLRSTTNTEPASQVISLGCSWPSGVIKAVHHPPFLPPTRQWLRDKSQIQAAWWLPLPRLAPSDASWEFTVCSSLVFLSPRVFSAHDGWTI